MPRSARRPSPPPVTGVNADHLRDFRRHLRGANRAERTIATYLADVELLAAHVGRDLAEVAKGDVEAFLAAELDHCAPASVGVRYRSIRRFYSWMVAEGLVDVSPVAGVPHPTVPDDPPQVMPDDYLGALLASMNRKRNPKDSPHEHARKTFEDRRDTAMVRLFVDTGMRRGGMAGIMLNDLDLDIDVVRITLKGGRSLACPFGPKTGEAITRYLRVRAQHRQARLPNLWIGARGAMTGDGIAQMLERRAAAAGLPHVHPHLFRHKFAHDWKAAGGSEEDLMMLGGWVSREMVQRYGRSVAAERAVEAHRRMRLADRL